MARVHIWTSNMLWKNHLSNNVRKWTLSEFQISLHICAVLSVCTEWQYTYFQSYTVSKVKFFFGSEAPAFGFFNSTVPLLVFMSTTLKYLNINACLKKKRCFCDYLNSDSFLLMIFFIKCTVFTLSIGTPFLLTILVLNLEIVYSTTSWCV